MHGANGAWLAADVSGGEAAVLAFIALLLLASLAMVIDMMIQGFRKGPE